jgi:hypothetical protein
MVPVYSLLRAKVGQLLLLFCVSVACLQPFTDILSAPFESIWGVPRPVWEDFLVEKQLLYFGVTFFCVLFPALLSVISAHAETTEFASEEARMDRSPLSSENEGTPIGELLVASGALRSADVARILEYQETHGGLFGDIAVRRHNCKGDAVDAALKEQARMRATRPAPA